MICKKVFKVGGFDPASRYQVSQQIDKLPRLRSLKLSGYDLLIELKAEHAQLAQCMQDLLKYLVILVARRLY
jgi:hypothetical protein